MECRVVSLVTDIRHFSNIKKISVAIKEQPANN